MTFLTSAEPPSSPRGPIELRLVASDSAEISWQPPEYSGGIPLTGYQVEMRTSSSTYWRRLAVVDPLTTSYTLNNLLEGNEYTIRVIARNREGDSFPLISEVLTIPKPTGK